MAVGMASHDPYQVEVYHPVEVAAEGVVVYHHFLTHIRAWPLNPSVLDCNLAVDASSVGRCVVAAAATVTLPDQRHGPYPDQPRCYSEQSHLFRMVVVVPPPPY